MYELIMRMTDNSVIKKLFKSKKEAYDFVYLEGDHVMMYSIQRIKH